MRRGYTFRLSVTISWGLGARLAQARRNASPCAHVLVLEMCVPITNLVPRSMASHCHQSSPGLRTRLALWRSVSDLDGRNRSVVSSICQVPERSEEHTSELQSR